MQRDPSFLFEMLEAATAILEFTDGMTKETFVTDRMVRSAVQFETAILGEASKSVSDETKLKHGSIPWKRIIQLRNFYLHGYHRVEPSEVWRTARSIARQVVDALSPHIQLVDPEESCIE